MVSSTLCGGHMLQRFLSQVLSGMQTLSHYFAFIQGFTMNFFFSFFWRCEDPSLSPGLWWNLSAVADADCAFWKMDCIILGMSLCPCLNECRPPVSDIRDSVTCGPFLERAKPIRALLTSPSPRSKTVK